MPGPSNRSDERLSNLVFEGGSSRPRPPNDPMADPPDPVLAFFRGLAATWRRLLSDQEGL